MFLMFAGGIEREHGFKWGNGQVWMKCFLHQSHWRNILLKVFFPQYISWYFTWDSTNQCLSKRYSWQFTRVLVTHHLHCNLYRFFVSGLFFCLVYSPSIPTTPDMSFGYDRWVIIVFQGYQPMSHRV